MKTRDQFNDGKPTQSKTNDMGGEVSRRRFLFELGVKSATVLAAGHVMGCGPGDDDDMSVSPTPSGSTPTPTPSGDTPTPWGDTPTPWGDTPTPWGETPTPPVTPTPEVVFENAIVGEVLDGVSQDLGQVHREW